VLLRRRVLVKVRLGVLRMRKRIGRRRATSSFLASRNS